jgi:hypothetical protein
MASLTAAKKSQCFTCKNNTGIFICGGCTRAFCKKHANEHRQILGKQMDVVIFEYDQLRQNINEKIDRIYQSSSMKEIDEWERQSIDKISQITKFAREKVKQCVIKQTEHIQIAAQELMNKIESACIEDDFLEMDLKIWSDKIKQLKTDLSVSLPIFFKSIDNDLIRFDSHPNPQDHSRSHIIELLKTSKGLGLTIDGGRNENSPIHISRIHPNGAAWNHGGLKEGDQLLSVNGVSVENEYHEKAVDLLKQAQGSVKLVVHYSSHGFNQMTNYF